MNLVLFDEPNIRTSLLPLTYTRPVAEIRIGILKISEKWAKYFGQVSFKTEDYLSSKYPEIMGTETIYINGAACPSPGFVKAIQLLSPGESLWSGEDLIATFDLDAATNSKRIGIERDFTWVDKVWKIFKHNASEIKADFSLITKDRKSASITDKHTSIYGEENIFVEEGVSIKAAVINAENGPIYIGKNVDIQEGSVIKGSHAFCDGAVVNMGAKLRGDSTIGPYSKVGGEVSNSVIFGYSNKGHERFLSKSVLVE